jgi:hypothetical protein
LRHFALIHRISILAFVALAGVLLHPGSVSAVALGNIALQSSLGQPLRVAIPVALSAGETLDTSCLKLVRDPMDGTPQLLTGRVSVERNAASTQLIVTTPRAVDEPALRLSVQAGCGATMRRDYVLLLDPQGTESSAVLASADLDEFRNYAGAARPATPTRRAQRVVASTAPSPYAAPSPTTFTPIYPPAPVAVARTQKTTPPAAVVALTPPGEPVALVATQLSSGFIAEAAAASLSRVSTERSNTNRVAASSPAALLQTRAEVPEATLWTQTWPYAAVLLSIGAIALTAFAKRRRLVVPAWGATTLSNGKTPTQSTGTANTFAHFAAMTEPAPIMLRAISLPAVDAEETYDASLDTLLQEPDVEVDGIDEHVIRKAWAMAATEGAADIGSDSILKAIAAAERDLHISPPEPAQAAIDKALDDDLIHDSKLHLSSKR